MGKYNDLDPKKWREYDDIETDSLWIIEQRDNSGVHSGSYHGNFVPQIPNQLLRRYTKEGDWVLDPFMGSGTTLIEAQRLNRNSIGIDIQDAVVQEAHRRVTQEKKDFCRGVCAVADSQTVDLPKLLTRNNIPGIQFVIFHPPYWDIIKFSDKPNDISNAASLQDYLNSFGQVIDNCCAVLDKNRYCACIIGDKYANGEIIPLGFYCMNLFLEQGFIQKAIIIKNFGETKGKSGKQGIWRYRSITNDFYIFKHEYVFVFKKIK